MFSRMAAWATRSPKESLTLATHQAKFYCPKTIIHAVSPVGVTVDQWDPYKAEIIQAGDDYAVMIRREEISNKQIEKMHRLMEKMRGWKYSNGELVLQFIDGIIAKIFDVEKKGFDAVLFRHLSDWDKTGIICSRTGNWISIKMGWLPDIPVLRHASPDDTWDHEYRSPEWELAEHSTGWFRKGV